MKITIDMYCCAECTLVDDAGFFNDEVYCNHADMPRDKNNKYINILDEIDYDEKIHSLCPYRAK